MSMPEDYDDLEDNEEEHYEDDFDGPFAGDYDDYPIDGVGFADPGGRSSLRRETPDNPRNLPCPNCGKENRLTPLDVQAGYQCNDCADQCERGF